MICSVGAQVLVCNAPKVGQARMTALGRYPIYSERKASRRFPSPLHTHWQRKREARPNCPQKWPRDYLQPVAMHSPSSKKW